MKIFRVAIAIIGIITDEFLKIRLLLVIDLSFVWHGKSPLLENTR